MKIISSLKHNIHYLKKQTKSSNKLIRHPNNLYGEKELYTYKQ